MSQTNRIQQLKRKWQIEASTSPDNTGVNKSVLSTPFLECAAAATVLKRFRMILKDGRVISIPYSTLPVTDYQPGGGLDIISHNYRITLHGRNLNTVQNYFSNEQLISVAESKTGMDSMESDQVFIARIELSGKLFERE